MDNSGFETFIQGQKELLPLYTITFIGTLGFGFILTFLVYLVIDYGGNALIYSLVASTYPAFQLPDLKPCAIDRYPEPQSFRKVLGQEQKECYWVVEKKIVFGEVFKLKYSFYADAVFPDLTWL